MTNQPTKFEESVNSKSGFPTSMRKNYIKASLFGLAMGAIPLGADLAFFDCGYVGQYLKPSCSNFILEQKP